MSKSSFGFKQVTKEIKTNLVDQVFASVASKYDLMNDVMSMGIHRLWKDQMVKQVPVISDAKILDMAGGTGDIAFRILKKYQAANTNLELTIADYNQEMLDEGKNRAIDENLFAEQLNFSKQNGEKTSFKANNFDIYTIAYGIRNFADLNKGVKEAYRVLKKSGKFLCLEFNQVEHQFLKPLYDFYSFQIIPRAGELITGDRESYQYFVESIRMFPDSDSFKQMLEAAGFKNVAYQKLTGGLTTLYLAEK